MLRKYIFITSSSYSGSTLLAYLLGSHSQIATIGEARGLNLDLDPDEYMCSCGEKFVACGFWNDIERRMKNKISPSFNIRELNTKFLRRSEKIHDRLQFSNLRIRTFEKIRDLFYMNVEPYANHANAIVAQNIALAESVTEHYRKDVYLDTSKTPKAIPYLSKSMPCEFKVIYLFRDGRAVFNSFLKRQVLGEREAIKEWIRKNKMIMRKLEDLPGQNVLYVRYSDLCADTIKTLERIFKFIGVGYEEQCLHYWAHEHHIIGNIMRLSLKKEIVQDESWRKKLTPAQLDLFNKIGGRYNTEWNNLFRDAQVPQTCMSCALARSEIGHVQ